MGEAPHTSEMGRPPTPRIWGGQTTPDGWEVEEREWMTPPGLPRVTSLDAEHSGTTKAVVFSRSKMGAAGREVVTV